MASMAETLAQVNGKTIGATAVTVASLFGTLPGNVVGWRIGAKDSQAAPADRLEIHWGDATAQEEVCPAGVALDWTTCPVRDPADVYVKRGTGTDATNVVITVFSRIDGN